MEESTQSGKVLDRFLFREFNSVFVMETGDALGYEFFGIWKYLRHQAGIRSEIAQGYGKVLALFCRSFFVAKYKAISETVYALDDVRITLLGLRQDTEFLLNVADNQ